MRSIILIILIVFSSCKSVKVIEKGVKKDSITTITKVITERDTILKIEKDSSLYNAYIKCVNKEPILIVDTLEIVKYSKITPKVSLNDGKLEVNCVKEAEELFFKWKQEYIKENTKTTIKETNVVEVPRQLTWWQKLFIKLGQIFIGVLIVYGFIKFNGLGIIKRFI